MADIFTEDSSKTEQLIPSLFRLITKERKTFIGDVGVNNPIRVPSTESIHTFAAGPVVSPGSWTPPFGHFPQPSYVTFPPT